MASFSPQSFDRISTAKIKKSSKIRQKLVALSASGTTWRAGVYVAGIGRNCGEDDILTLPDEM